MENITLTHCYHCGEQCDSDDIRHENHSFCCVGCKTVYGLLKDSGLDSYYSIGTAPGAKQAEEDHVDQHGLEEEQFDRFIDFREGEIVRITFYVPNIHCSACIWLLENLSKLAPGVVRSDVNFLRREVSVVLNQGETTLNDLVALLKKIGYAADLNHEVNKVNTAQRILILKLGTAGFVFGNVMLFSFPEYLSVSEEELGGFSNLFAWLNLVLSLPIIGFSATDYLVGAWKSIRLRYLTIDVPIALGIVTLFLRSSFEVITQSGPGYFDSLAGLVFFLLVGRWFQSKTFAALAFDRDFRSYFPMNVTKLVDGERLHCRLEDVEPGDRLLVLTNQIIPADSILLSPKACLDYSFVSGEAEKVFKTKGDELFGGGRQTSGAIEVLVKSSVEHGYLTRLWSQQYDHHAEERTPVAKMIDRVSKFFSIGVLSLALVVLVAWLFIDPSKAVDAFTAVLIIACPCALALTMPFAIGNVSRRLSKKGVFLKNAEILESIAGINAFVFDKTGTLTEIGESEVQYDGTALTDLDQKRVMSMVRASSHPMSQAVANDLNLSYYDCEITEIKGQGLQAIFDGHSYKIGSPDFCHVHESMVPHTSGFALTIDGVYQGYFVVKKKMRFGIQRMLRSLASIGSLHLISGDNDSARQTIEEMFPDTKHIHFNQSPEDKLSYVQTLEKQGLHTMMIGDGLNDAGALKASCVGVSVADDVFSFSPACDVIMYSENLKHFHLILTFIKASMKVVKWSIGLSVLYNLVGLYFAVQAELTPVIAAILMPLSSITIVSFVVVFTTILSKKLRAIPDQNQFTN